MPRGSCRVEQGLSDWIARHRGEEFVLVMSEITLTEAARVAEKVRTQCASTPMDTRSGQRPLDHLQVPEFRLVDEPGKVYRRAGAPRFRRQGNDEPFAQMVPTLRLVP
jgi:GGDEF domain-containing protein